MVRMKKTAIAAIAAAVITALTLSSGAAEYTAVREYNNRFTDVAENQWYYKYIKDAYSLGLIDGATETLFDPSGNVTVAQTVKLASVCHQLLKNGASDPTAFETASAKWYDGYLSYAKKNNIVTEDYENYNAEATRAQIAVLFSRALRDSGAKCEIVNKIGTDTIKDVDRSLWYAGPVYNMYMWGIIVGDGQGNINAESKVKRSEIAAVIMRVVDPDNRILPDGTLYHQTEAKPEEPENDSPLIPEVPPTADNTDKDSINRSSLELYKGTLEKRDFTGVTGVAAVFELYDGKAEVKNSYALENLSTVVLEEDNISFRLYKNYGYEALGIVRGWLYDSATGINGDEVNDSEEVKDGLSKIFRMWIDGALVPISELWYMDHGDYTTYAFYFDKDIKIPDSGEVAVCLGKFSGSTLSESGLGIVNDYIDNADIYNEIEEKSDKTDAYTVVINNAVTADSEILFEKDSSRCTVLYGKGLYGGSSDEYRLILVFYNGKSQTLATEKLSAIRFDKEEDVLYYSLNGLDGEEIIFGVNFGT